MRNQQWEGSERSTRARSRGECQVRKRNGAGPLCRTVGQDGPAEVPNSEAEQRPPAGVLGLQFSNGRCVAAQDEEMTAGVTGGARSGERQVGRPRAATRFQCAQSRVFLWCDDSEGNPSRSGFFPIGSPRRGGAVGAVAHEPTDETTQLLLSRRQPGFRPSSPPPAPAGRRRPPRRQLTTAHAPAAVRTAAVGCGHRSATTAVAYPPPSRWRLLPSARVRPPSPPPAVAV